MILWKLLKILKDYHLSINDNREQLYSESQIPIGGSANSVLTSVVFGLFIGFVVNYQWIGFGYTRVFFRCERVEMFDCLKSFTKRRTEIYWVNLGVFFLNLFAAKQKLRIFGNLCKNFGDCKSIRHQLSKIVTKQPKALGEIVFSVITKISDLSLFSWLIVVYFFLFFKMPFVHCSWVL